MPRYRIISGSLKVDVTTPNVKEAIRSFTIEDILLSAPIIKVENTETTDVFYFKTNTLIEIKDFYKECISPDDTIRGGVINNEI